ncbi:MAG: radical SAM protein [archaeon]
MQSIIDKHKIMNEIKAGKEHFSLDELLDKAKECGGLSAIETNALFQRINEENVDDALKTAREVKGKTKGNRAALYTCLYISNYCANACPYCGYNRDNKRISRIMLTPAQIREEAKAILQSGVTDAIIIGGSLPEHKYKKLILEATHISREEGLNPWIEFENLTVNTLRELHVQGANSFVLFQETYDRELYRTLHANSPYKKDYDIRLEETEKAVYAGFENIGIGSLLGLNLNYSFELLGLYHHAQHLLNKGLDVCISLSSLKQAPGIKIENYAFSSIELEKMYLALRLAIPGVSLSLSGREPAPIRNKLFPIIDHIGTGGVPNPGGRTAYREEYEKGETQFVLQDKRTPAQIKTYLSKIGIEAL